MEKIIIEIIQKYITPKLIYIFGSYNTEYFNKESDIDIAVLSENKITEENMWKIKLDLINETGKEIDFIDLNSAGIILKKEVVYKGKAIFFEDEKTKYEFEYRQAVLYGQYLDDVSIVVEKIKERGYIYERNNIIES